MWASGAALVGALGWVGWHFFSEKRLEKPRYRVLNDRTDVEIRQYAASLVAATELQGSFEQAVDTGFHRLAGYIFGGNRGPRAPEDRVPARLMHESAPLQGQRLEMTAPVGLQRRGGGWRMTFLMPSEFTLDTLPEPLDSRVRLAAEPARRVAVRRFSGPASESAAKAEEARLLEDIKRLGLRPLGEPVLAQYNSPFLPSFLRHNEILVEVEELLPLH